MKILHASDFHLDSSFHRLSAEQAMTRRSEMRDLPAAMARFVQEEQIDLVLLPGDLFDGERVYPETVETLTAALGSMKVPVVIAPGNHDCLGPRSPYLTASWPENVHIFTSRNVSCFEFPELNCVVHGYAFDAPHRTDEPLRGFAAPEDGRIHLLCAHGEVSMGGDYAPITPAALGNSGIVYAALGHIHAATGLNWEGDTAWAYCGCTEGRGFDELGAKGALLVNVDDNGVSASFVPFSCRQYRIEKVNINELDIRLKELAGDDLVRIILTGESRRAFKLSELLDEAKPNFFHVEFRDETTLPQDLWQRADEDTLTGLFLREMRRRLDNASEEERLAVLLAARFGLAALEGGEDICP